MEKLEKYWWVIILVSLGLGYFWYKNKQKEMQDLRKPLPPVNIGGYADESSHEQPNPVHEHPDPLPIKPPVDKIKPHPVHEQLNDPVIIPGEDTPAVGRSVKKFAVKKESKYNIFR
jgi:hypothetical protein